MMNKKLAVWGLTLVFIILEQGIKLIINNGHLDAHVPILEPLLYFDPMFNRDYSWFNSMFQFGAGKWEHAAVVFIMLVFTVLFYIFLNTRSSTSLLTDTAFAFLIAAAACSLIDKVFWNGSLDYILVKDFFTFDLKDVYINVFIGLILLIIAMDHRGIRSVDDKEVVKAFFRFLRRR
jgi:signal peptidase II